MSEHKHPTQSPKPSTAGGTPYSLPRTVIRKITSPIINGYFTLLQALLYLILSSLLLLLGLIRFVIDAILYFPRTIINSLALFNRKSFKAISLTVNFVFVFVVLSGILLRTIEQMSFILRGQWQPMDCSEAFRNRIIVRSSTLRLWVG
jgi:hypothetical protein